MMRHTDRREGGRGMTPQPSHRRHIPARQHNGGLPDPMFQQTFTIPS